MDAVGTSKYIGNPGSSMFVHLAVVARDVDFVLCAICVNCSLVSRTVCDVALTLENKVQAMMLPGQLLGDGPGRLQGRPLGRNPGLLLTGSPGPG